MLNISVDTLRPERFERMTRRRGHERVMDAIHHAIRLGFDPVKACSLHEMSSQPLGMITLCNAPCVSACEMIASSSCS